MTFKRNFALKILCLVYLSNFAVDSQLLKCSNQPCKNGGQCVEQPGTFYGYNCRCVGSWKGVNCDQDVVVGESPRSYNNQYNPNYPNAIPSWQNQNSPLWNNNQNQNNPLYPNNNNNLNNNPLWNNQNQNNPLYPNNNNNNNLNNQYNRPNNPNWNNNQYNNPNNPNNNNNPLWNSGLNNQNNPLWNNQNQNQNNPLYNHHNNNNPLYNNAAHNPYDNRYPNNIMPYGNNNNPLALNDPCINNPCQNGGYCQRSGLGLGGFACTCSSGFYGNRCENYASQRTMLLGIILGTVLPGCAFIIICAIIIYCCCCRRRLK